MVKIGKVVSFAVEAFAKWAEVAYVDFLEVCTWKMAYHSRAFRKASGWPSPSTSCRLLTGSVLVSGTSCGQGQGFDSTGW